MISNAAGVRVDSGNTRRKALVRGIVGFNHRNAVGPEDRPGRSKPCLRPGRHGRRLLAERMVLPRVFVPADPHTPKICALTARQRLARDGTALDGDGISTDQRSAARLHQRSDAQGGGAVSSRTARQLDHVTLQQRIRSPLDCSRSACRDASRQPIRCRQLTGPFHRIAIPIGDGDVDEHVRKDEFKVSDAPANRHRLRGIVECSAMVCAWLD